MIYIVSGYMRTGTTMMMKALKAGGMDVKYKSVKFYELDREEYKKEGFPLKYKNQVIKILWGGLWKMPVDEYKIVYMTRNVEDIEASYIRLFPDATEIPGKKNIEKLQTQTIEQMKNRKDVKSIDVFDYNEAIAEPKKVFDILKANGWNITVSKAITSLNA